MATFRKGVFALLCVGSLLVSTGVLAGGKSSKGEAPPAPTMILPLPPQDPGGSGGSMRSMACNLARGRLASLEQDVLTASDYVAWVARYRTPKAELDRSVESCFQGLRTFSYGPIGSRWSSCYGKYTNPCARTCFDGGTTPPVDPNGCRYLFCKRSVRLIENIATESPATEALMHTSSDKFRVIQTLNEDRDRYRRELKLTDYMTEDPDPAIVEREAVNTRTTLERRLPATREAVTRACGS